MRELYDQLNGISFIADDERMCEELSAESCLLEPGIDFESDVMPAGVEDLDEEYAFTGELAKLIRNNWTASKRGLCEKALLLENTYYKIQAGRRLPGRDTIICLALTLKLEIPETQHLLGYLGYGLSDQFKRDYIILRCLELRKEPLEVNLLLEQCGLRLLGPNE